MKMGAILAGGIIAFCLLTSTIARAEEHDQLTPLLIDLDGWSAPAAQGMSLSMPGLKMINANRRFTRGGKVIDATIVVNSGPGQAGDLKDSVMEDSNRRVRTRKVAGFWVTSTHVKKNDSGQLVVFLAKNQDNSSLLTVNYQKMSEEEALEIVRGLDWENIKAVVEGML